MFKKGDRSFYHKMQSTLAGRLTSIYLALNLVALAVVSVSVFFNLGPNGNRLAAITVSSSTLVFTASIFLIVVRRIIAPLETMTDFMQHANLRRLGARLDIATGDELEQLSRAINTMLQRLDASMQRIQRMSFVDTVTELPNRERFKQEAEEVIKSAISTKGVGAAISIDIDRFLRVQNTLGKVVGEELLGLVTERLDAAVRASDRIVRLKNCETRPALLARMGGSEFAILIPDVEDPTGAGKFAQLVAASLRQPFELQHHRIVLGASCGIAVFPQDGESGDEIIRSAELAMTHARNAGGGRSMFFTRKLNQRALSKLILENEIRQGIEKSQFVPYFQPKVDLGTGRIVGCEALVRWNHPKYGMVSPARFIPAAEESGLIGPLGDVILRESARYAASWLLRGIALRVAVNVSTAQFSDDNFNHKVCAALKESGLPPSLFELEITESIAMSNPERVQRLLEPLRLKGVKIAIDDFGTGHSNLASLTSLPFDVFKIDQSFIHALGKDKHAPALIETIIAMAGGLNYETVAEGVETEEQAAFLRKRGATLGQGYLFGAPMAPEAFEAYAREWVQNGIQPPLPEKKNYHDKTQTTPSELSNQPKVA